MIPEHEYLDMTAAFVAVVANNAPTNNKYLHMHVAVRTTSLAIADGTQYSRALPFHPKSMIRSAPVTNQRVVMCPLACAIEPFSTRVQKRVNAMMSTNR